MPTAVCTGSVGEAEAVTLKVKADRRALSRFKHLVLFGIFVYGLYFLFSVSYVGFTP